MEKNLRLANFGPEVRGWPRPASSATPGKSWDNHVPLLPPEMSLHELCFKR